MREIKRLAWSVLLIATIAVLATEHGGGNVWTLIVWGGTIAAIAVLSGVALVLGIVGIVFKRILTKKG